MLGKGALGDSREPEEELSHGEPARGKQSGIK
jgi:hypothetical protein